MMSRLPVSPATEKRKSMFSTLFSSNKTTRASTCTPGMSQGEHDCLHDETLESPALTAIWRSATSNLDADEKALLEALHAAYVSRTEALRTYQDTVLSLTEQLTDLRTSNSALKAQLDITTQAHASLLNEITNLNCHPSIVEEGRMTPQSEGDDSGCWSDSGLGAEDDTLTYTRDASPGRGLMRRGSGVANWLQRRSSASGESGEIKLLRKENMRLREEVERLESVLEDCSIVLAGLDTRDRR